METDKVIPNCSHCKEFLIWEDGDGWNEPRITEIDCNSEINSEEEVEEYLTSDEKDVRKCSGFKPIIVEECSNCKKPMNIPLYKCKYSDCIYDVENYCSQACKEESWEKFRKQMDI